MNEVVRGSGAMATRLEICVVDVPNGWANAREPVEIGGGRDKSNCASRPAKLAKDLKTVSAMMSDICNEVIAAIGQRGELSRRPP
ncbi:hypothetical protein [Sphingomonas sp. PvP056]|uniref:hypothetical protein n=1 Tax=Sphingomonas sp. PvP056 TaxID=3156392 RepID=UPI0033957214